MAPGIITTPPEPAHVLSSKRDNNNAPRDIFPDGLRTSGQTEPNYDLLHPYEQFPRHISGPTVWRREDFVNSPEKWVHVFQADEIEELGTAADEFIARKIPLTGISRANFVLPRLSKVLNDLREDLLNGKGFILFKGFPVDQWGNEKSAVAYMGLGTHIGYFVSQNGLGHVLGHVKDVEQIEDAAKIQIDKTRIYRTNARQFFHADDADVVGLLCISRALEGGESDIVSSNHVWNVLQQERPDVAKLLSQPIWYFDRKGEVSQGQQEWIRKPVFYKEVRSNGRVFSHWDPYFIRSLTRFSDKGIVPALSPAQDEAARVLESVCAREALHMVLEVGDIQFLSDLTVFHSRTAYKDYPPPAPRRHLMRLWLATPESEGGWCVPFEDSDQKKRGGIQVDDHPPRAPLDAE